VESVDEIKMQACIGMRAILWFLDRGKGNALRGVGNGLKCTDRLPCQPATMAPEVFGNVLRVRG
jgi:hypothetical protein